MASYNSFKKINSESIIDSAVIGSKFANSAITADKINNNAIQTVDIQNLSVGTNQLTNNLNLSSKTVTYRSILNTDISNTAGIAGSKLASGAVVANLGFTPINRAGDTISGQLTLANGTAAAPSLTGTSNTNAGIYFPTTNQIGVSTNSTVRLTVDQSGRTLMPNQPAFYAAGNGGWFYHNSFPSTASPGGQWRELINGWAWQVIQQGGSNMSSQGRFTAPTAGYYYFYAQTYHYNDTNNSNGYSHFNIGRNSSTDRGWTGRRPHTIYAHGVPSHHAPGIMASVNMYLNAGDYASVCPYMAPVARFHGNHSLFCGYLIG
jgi:hypothetical protein